MLTLLNKRVFFMLQYGIHACRWSTPRSARSFLIGRFCFLIENLNLWLIETPLVYLLTSKWGYIHTTAPVLSGTVVIFPSRKKKKPWKIKYSRGETIEEKTKALQEQVFLSRNKRKKKVLEEQVSRVETKEKKKALQEQAFPSRNKRKQKALEEQVLPSRNNRKK